jgi:hypothetical protein
VGVSDLLDFKSPNLASPILRGRMGLRDSKRPIYVYCDIGKNIFTLVLDIVSFYISGPVLWY